MRQMAPSCSMRTDRHDEANIRFSQFCEKVMDDIGICIYQSRHCQLSTVALVKYEPLLWENCFTKFPVCCLYCHRVGSWTLDTTAWISLSATSTCMCLSLFICIHYSGMFAIFLILSLFGYCIFVMLLSNLSNVLLSSYIIRRPCVGGEHLYIFWEPRIIRMKHEAHINI